MLLQLSNNWEYLMLEAFMTTTSGAQGPQKLHLVIFKGPCDARIGSAN